MGELVPAVRGEPVSSIITLLAGSYTPDPLWGDRSKTFEDEIFTLVNKYRSAKGIHALQKHTQLNNCAGWKSLHMTNYKYMAHDDPAPPIERSCSTRFATFGYNYSWGENIAYGYTTPESVMSGWLNSPGHKANIENGAYFAIGIGAALKIGSSWAWVQCFGAKADETNPLPEPEPMNKILSFIDRHAIGVMWDKEAIPDSRVLVQVKSDNTSWVTVHEQANTGNTYLTYPLSYIGLTRVRIVGGGFSIEGSVAVKKATIS